MNTDNYIDLCMLSPLLSKSNDLIAYLMLSISTESAGIYFFHTLYIALLNIKGEYFSTGLIVSKTNAKELCTNCG